MPTLGAIMKILATLLSLFSLLLGLAISLTAQTRTPLPTLTTDDVVAARPAVPVPTAPAKEAAKVAGKEEKSAGTDVPKTIPPPANEDPQKIAEKNWNERLRKAQEKARAMESQADQTDLTITQLRNQLFSAEARAPEANGKINARITELFAQTNRLRAEAKVAQQEIEVLEAEASANQYKVQQVALTNEKGEPDKAAYQGEYDKLQSELQAARARVEVLQLRLSGNHADTLKKASGDNFTLNRLREEKEQTTAELAATRAKIETLTNQLQTHRQKAAATGIPLEVR